MKRIGAPAPGGINMAPAVKVLARKLVHVKITFRSERYFYDAFIPIFGKKCGKHDALHAQAIVNNTLGIAFIVAKGIKLCLAKAAV